MNLLPTIRIGQLSVTRLIIGGNPFSGNSHQSAEMDRAFVDYYTADNIKKALFECEQWGINAVQARADRHIRRVLHEYWNEGGKLIWIAQTASELRDLFSHVRQISGEAAAIYIHGTWTDSQWRAGNMDEVKRLLDAIKETGVPAGIGTHIPDVLLHCERTGFEPDFYMASFYNPSPCHRSPIITGAQQAETFDDSDRDRMCAAIRSVNRPCLAFKILAAGRKCRSPQDVREAFRFAFANIKPSDGVVVGVFQRDTNQIRMNAEIVSALLSSQA